MEQGLQPLLKLLLCPVTFRQAEPFDPINPQRHGSRLRLPPSPEGHLFRTQTQSTGAAPIGDVCNADDVSTLLVESQSAGTADGLIIRMGRNGQDP